MNKNIPAGTRNESTRREWIEKALSGLPSGSTILDAGAGEQQYKKFCAHLKYVSQDFARYSGGGDGKGLQKDSWAVQNVDIVSDIADIPVEDQSFDAILCSEVLEHLPDPVKALKEFFRILKPGGYLILTAPFCSLTHFSPYFYSTGFSPEYYRHWFNQIGFEIKELDYNGNYFEYIAQELRRLPRVSQQFSVRMPKLTEKILIPYLLKIISRLSSTDKGSHDLLSFGIHIIASKKSG